MRQALFFALTSLLGTGCGSVSTDAATNPHNQVNASRLVARELEALGAPPLMLGIFDTQEKLPCAFMRDSAGQLRCLPFPPNNVELWQRFADSDCKTPIYVASTASGLPPTETLVSVSMSSSMSSSSCDPERHLVGRLSPLPANALQYVVDPQGACVPTEAGRPAGPSAVLVPVAPEAWVAGVEVDGPRLSDRLRVRQFQTADGATFPDHFVDAHWGKPCQPLLSGPGDLKCWPETAQVEDDFSDGECQSKIALVVGDTCPPPAFAAKGNELFALGERWDRPVFKRTKTCFDSSGAGQPPATFFRVGAALGMDALSGLSFQLAGTGRIRVRGLRDDQGRFLVISDAMRAGQLPAFYDTDAHEDCTPVWNSRQAAYCLPSSVATSVYSGSAFADAACRQPAYYCATDHCDELTVVLTGPEAQSQEQAPSLHRAIALEHAYLGDEFGRCTLSDLSIRFFSAGPEVPWDEYPRLTERNAPGSGG